MKQLSKYPADKIKNIVVTGHGNSGKTSLVEAMLYISGATDRMGKTADGTATSTPRKSSANARFLRPSRPWSGKTSNSI